MELDPRQEERKKSFKQTPVADLPRCRESYAFMLRKSKRNTDINSRRMVALGEITENMLQEAEQRATIAGLVQREPELENSGVAVVHSAQLLFCL